MFIGAERFLAFLLGSHLGNIPMKFESHWPKGSEELAFIANYSRFSIFSICGHFVPRSKIVLAILVEDHLSNIPTKLK